MTEQTYTPGMPLADAERKSLRLTIEKLEAELAGAKTEISGLVAARIAYASEFDGDVGSIHENIRKIKAELAEAREWNRQMVEKAARLTRPAAWGSTN